MLHVISTGVLAVVLATQAVNTRGCRDDNSGGNTTTAPPVSTSDVFTTRDGVRFRVETVVTGLEIPWALAFAPDGRLFVTERPGRVRIVTLSSGQSEIALTVDGVYAQGEAGALGLALDPEFSQNRFVYLYYSASVGNGGVNRIVRYREGSGRLTERVILLDNIPAATIHDGGRLRFGPDGLLYASAGDSANQNLAQDVASLAGKLLRINRDGTTPRDNRFSSPVFTYGHRNPQGFDWHPSTGALWESEHGNVGNDEINFIQSGLNYGWPRIEAANTMPNMETPETFFNPSIAPSGASFYRGQRIPQFTNNLFIATLRGTHLLRVTLDSSARRITSQERLIEGVFGRLRDVVSGPDGSLYILTNNITPSDRVLRIVPAN